MSVLLHFEEYQKARVKFVQAIAEAATRPQNIEVMNNAGVMQLLRPLLLDNVSEIIAIMNSAEALLFDAGNSLRSDNNDADVFTGSEHSTDCCTCIGSSSKLQ
jgi:hypothetical protein